MTIARDIRVRGVVQGVGFRPHVYRLAESNALSGWVANDADGVEIHLEGSELALEEFVRALVANYPAAAEITTIDVQNSEAAGIRGFSIRESLRDGASTTRISPDLPVCDACLQELFDPAAKRFRYAYINCTDCGPRYSIIVGLPYDRCKTTMQGWPLDGFCSAQYHDPADRRFHAQPVACPGCGPHHHLEMKDQAFAGDEASVSEAVKLLNSGAIVAVKGVGGYHLACDGGNAAAVQALRDRKYRKEKPFALMVKNIETARSLVELSPEAEKLMQSVARPIVLTRALVPMREIAPENDDLGVMLPYSPLHHLLFRAGAPEVLVMTSANRSNEPIAYEDSDARERLAGIADAFLIGARPIARRVDDSIARAGVFGPVILRRSRGYAPSAVAMFPFERPILAVGADLKNAITLVVNGQAFVSQHVGDLDQYQCLQAFHETIDDLTSMYQVRRDGLLIAHDAHPQYRSSIHAREQSNAEAHAVQHHRAHVASVLAERSAWDKRVLGVSFDGTGYGDDGTIWGGELFVGSVSQGFERAAHLRAAELPGGDGAARYPVQAAAGFLWRIDHLADLTAAPFHFPKRLQTASIMAQKGLRTFSTTSAGRLFDAAAALLGFTRESTFEGQAAMWVEHLARSSLFAGAYPFPFVGGELDYGPLLEGLIQDRVSGKSAGACARAFQRGFAKGLWHAVNVMCLAHSLDTVVLSGGVFQNELLLEDLKSLNQRGDLEIWTNHLVPPNDGGISLGQAALAGFAWEHR